MLLSQLLKYLNISIDFNEDVDILSISDRAQEIQKGALFFAVKGLKSDGADFICEAERNGAVAIMSDRPVSTTLPLIVVSDIRKKMAETAALFYSTEHLKKIAVTGTNGKTSTVFFVQQLMNEMGVLSAGLGTIGIESPVMHRYGSMTTPDPISLNHSLFELSSKNVQLVALEASSHGLDQHRLAGLTFQAAGFTNITRDHLDYHGTMEAYLKAKMRLFSECLSPDGIAVINADIPEYAQIKSELEKRKIRFFSYGQNGETFRLIQCFPLETGQQLTFEAFGERYTAEINIFGDFQVMNLLCALGLCVAIGADLNLLVSKLKDLKAPAGRLECVGQSFLGGQVFVDYAHTPDALKRVLISLRPHTKGRLICLFGCGGNRDTGKRAQMGKIAQQLADIVYITDDNPRFEDPELIRFSIKEACPQGIEIHDRAEAIHMSVSQLKKGDVLVVAGKGHEEGQIINGVSYVFNDKTEVQLALLKNQKDVLWSVQDLRLALSGNVADIVTAYGVSIDTRTLKTGDLFVALKGDHSDGHDFVKKAIQKGAAACLVDHLIPEVPERKQIIVKNTQEGLEALARYARMRSDAIFIGVTGSAGKTTTKEMLKACLSEQGSTYGTEGNYNNHIGVPLTLARMPIKTEYAVIEMGMNHTGELIKLSDMVRPDVSIITMIGSAHREFFNNEQEIAAAKAEIFEYQNKQGAVILNKDDVFYDFLSENALKQGIKKIISFGKNPNADLMLTRITMTEKGMLTHMKWHGSEYTYALGFIGEHFALDSLGVLAVIDSVGGSSLAAMKVLGSLHPIAGRGAIETVLLESGVEIHLINDAYNANPSSMKASLNTLGLTDGRRKIAVLGDMLELGDEGPQMHRDLKQSILENEIDLVYTVGSLMKSLYNDLPDCKKGGWAQTSEEILPLLKQNLKEGDLVLVKASFGTRFSVIISGLKGEK